MEPIYWVILASVVCAAVVIALAWRPMREARRERVLAEAKRQFHRSRERLEAKFVQQAGNSGKPRGLRWVDCDFDNDVTYARDRRNGQLSAFVACTIRFEAIEGGGMEEVEAVSNLRAATAVFFFDPASQWTSEGRALFNLNPTEAIHYYQANLELVAQEPASAS
ncbi:MAG: hypothetical protein SGJ20_05425 [Planctomycetota bacterium]|nr:hypothetical protein [Planctomycetota bacterium]